MADSPEPATGPATESAKESATAPVIASPDVHEHPPGTHPQSVTGVAAGIYGTIIAASVLAAGANESTLGVIALVVVTLVVYWFAEQYAHALAHSLAGRRAPRAAVLTGLREGVPMIQASYLPVLVLVGCWLLGFDTNTSVNVALAVCVGVLFTLGWRGAVRRGLLLRGKLLSSIVAGSFGVAVVLLKLLVTH